MHRSHKTLTSLEGQSGITTLTSTLHCSDLKITFSLRSQQCCITSVSVTPCSHTPDNLSHSANWNHRGAFLGQGNTWMQVSLFAVWGNFNHFHIVSQCSSVVLSCCTAVMLCRYTDFISKVLPVCYMRSYMSTSHSFKSWWCLIVFVAGK